MSRVGQFQNVAQHSGRVVVDDQGKVSTSNWKGSAVSLLKGKYKAENNQAKAAFVKSIKNAYGADAANSVALKLHMNDGKPLKLRQVRQLLADHVNINRQPTPLQKGDVNLLLQANGVLKGKNLVLTEGDYSTLGNLSLSVSSLKTDSPVLDQIVMTSDETLGQLIGECLKEANPTPADIAKIVKAIRHGCPNYVTSNKNAVVVKDKMYGNPQVLAQGNFGRAVRYTADDGKSIVVKFTKGNDDDAIAKTRSEVQTHRYANDGQGPGANHVAKLIAPLRTDDGQIGMILEDCELGDVSTFSKPNGPLDHVQAKGLVTPQVADKVKLKMTLDLLQAMEYLQNQRNMIHLDLKGQNVFMNASGELKIADFGEGISKMTLHETGVIGSPAYMAPEMIGASGVKAFNAKMDSYSLGVMIYELATGTLPFFENVNFSSQGFDASQEWFKTHNGIAEGNQSTGNPALDDLINGLTHKNPQERITLDEALKSPLLNSIKSDGQPWPELQQLAAAMVKRESLEKAVAKADPISLPAAQQALTNLENEIRGLSMSVELR